MTAEKKTTTKGKAEGSGSELRKRDADFFARLLEHPEVSPELKNTIHSAITELADETTPSPATLSFSRLLTFCTTTGPR